MSLIKLGKVSPLVRNYLKTSVSLSTLSSKENKIRVGKWDINYLKVGNGPHHIFCLPGMLGSIYTDFRPQIQCLDREKFTIVVWDPPGFGKSRPPDRDFSPNFFERDSEHAYELMKALNIPKYSLLGWSLGAWCSLIIAAKYPEVVDKLVVWGATAFFLQHDIDEIIKMRDYKAWSKKYKDEMIELYGEELFAEYSVRYIDAINTGYKNNQLRLSVERLKSIKCPTLILHGEKDPLVNYRHVSYLQSHIKGSKTYLYPEGKHNIHQAYSRDFNMRVEDFLIGTNRFHYNEL